MNRLRGGGRYPGMGDGWVCKGPPPGGAPARTSEGSGCRSGDPPGGTAARGTCQGDAGRFGLQIQ